MKKIAGFIRVVFLPLMVACSSTIPWQPTAVNDFKSVAGKWEGLLISDDARRRWDDRATLIIDDTGGYEAKITRTITTTKDLSVDYRDIELLPKQGKLILSDGKPSVKFENGGHMTAQLYMDSTTGVRILRAEGTTSQGFPYLVHLTYMGR